MPSRVPNQGSHVLTARGRYDQGLLGGILSGDRFQEMLGYPNPTMEGLLSGIYTVGCALGALVSFICEGSLYSCCGDTWILTCLGRG